MTEMAWTKKGEVTRWLGIGGSPKAVAALEKRLLDAGTHKVRIGDDRRESAIKQRWTDSDVLKAKTIDSGQPIWALERQASVFRAASEERARLLAEGNALWEGSFKRVEGRLRVDTDARARALTLFAQARAIKVGAPTLAFFLSGVRTKVNTATIK